VTYENFARGPGPEFMFTLGNHIVPPVPAHAANSWYQCQFPFPINAEELERCRNFLAGYRGINVYSNYTKKHVLHALKKYKLQSVPVQVINPPVPRIGGDAGHKKNIILTVGRFFSGGHSKRQDVMIAAFRDIIKNFRDEIEFHLAGSSIPEPSQMAYLAELQKMARGLPVNFHVNPTQEALCGLYRDAAIYWHGTGLQCDLKREPEKAEHFGISIVEAMSAECVPLAFNAGGPCEIIAHGVDGFLYDTTDSLVELTVKLLHAHGDARRIEMGRAAGVAAARYEVERFVSNVRRLVDKVDTVACDHERYNRGDEP
jgi:glycosyltransferase involved in cell wall biosynthesis